jgi:hypothetical protein
LGFLANSHIRWIARRNRAFFAIGIAEKSLAFLWSAAVWPAPTLAPAPYGATETYIHWWRGFSLTCFVERQGGLTNLMRFRQNRDHS